MVEAAVGGSIVFVVIDKLEGDGLQYGILLDKSLHGLYLNSLFTMFCYSLL